MQNATILNAHSRDEVVGLIAELDRRSKSARDFIVPANLVQFNDEGQYLHHVGVGDALAPYPLSPTAHSQVAEKLGIPRPYYTRMLSEYPELLAQNVNGWSERHDKNVMLRMLDDRVRAVLSDRYRPLDNYDLAFTAFKVVQNVGAEIHRATLTDDRFEMRVVHPDWREELRPPADGVDPVYGRDGGHTISRAPRGVLVPGAYISNSETGRGGLRVRAFVLDLICTNGMIGESSIAQVHIGGEHDLGLLSRETRSHKDAVFFEETYDVIASIFDRERFRALVDDIRGSADRKLAEPVQAVDNVVKNLAMTDDDREAIMRELIAPSHGRPAEGSVWNLISAITERAKVYQDSDPERVTELESAGLELAIRQPEYVAVR